MFHYFAGIRAPAAPDCPLLLVHTGGQNPEEKGYRLIWRGTRPGDTKEHFWLFTRQNSIRAPSPN
jgi:hypothetical protein